MSRTRFPGVPVTKCRGKASHQREAGRRTRDLTVLKETMRNFFFLPLRPQGPASARLTPHSIQFFFFEFVSSAFSLRGVLIPPGQDMKRGGRGAGGRRTALTRLSSRVPRAGRHVATGRPPWRAPAAGRSWAGELTDGWEAVRALRSRCGARALARAWRLSPRRAC